MGRKRKRGGGQKSGRESTGSTGGGGRKQKYSEDSSADEDETMFQEAGVMKVRTNPRNWVGGYGRLTTNNYSARYYVLWRAAPCVVPR